MAFGSHPTLRSFSRRLVTDALRNATRTVSEVSEMSSIHLLNPRVQAMRVDANRDPDAFWAQAASSLHWNRGWTKVFDWDAEKPDDRGRYFRWFVGGETNLAYNAVDRHVEAGKGGQSALICESERGGRSVRTYAQLRYEVM